MSKLMIGGLMMCLALLAVFAMPAEAVVSYTFSPGSLAYHDESGADLTDGVLAGPDRWTNPANVGWNDTESVVINIDLGANTVIGGVRGFFYSLGGENNMWYPIEVAVSVSTDGVNFSAPVSVFPVDTTIQDGTGKYTWIGVEFTPAAEIGRYVKMENFIHAGVGAPFGWLFLSEIEILAPTALQSFLANLQAQIDAISADIESLEELNDHVHDKGSGGRYTSPPIIP